MLSFVGAIQALRRTHLADSSGIGGQSLAESGNQQATFPAKTFYC